MNYIRTDIVFYRYDIVNLLVYYSLIETLQFFILGTSLLKNIKILLKLNYRKTFVN